MMTIEWQEAKLEDLNIRDLSQKAYNAFIDYWQGSENEFYEYMQKHNINYDFTANNLNELNQKTDEFLNSLADAVRKDIGKFDFRLSSAMTSRNIRPIEMSDYIKVTLKNDEVNTKEIYDTFLSFNSRSFIDFRSYNEHDNTLTFIYNRRGIFDENDRIAILKAKNSATMSDNFKMAKDNNFILSGLTTELAKENGVDFRFEYIGVGDVVKEVVMTAEEITGVAEKKEAKRDEAIEDIKIEQIARAELVKERAETRQSLSEDSNKKEVLREANTEIRIDVAKDINLDSLDKIVDDSIALYEKKEQEKLRIRLEKARSDANVVYKEMQERIANDGMSIYEAINFAKQKYREEHTVNMASAFLTKDILEVGLLKTDLDKKQNTIKSLSEELENSNNEITKREETISTLKGTVQTKINEMTNQEERHKKEIELLIDEAEKKFREFENGVKTQMNMMQKELEDKDEEILSQDGLITRLKSQLELLQAQNETLQSKNEELIRENASLNFNREKISQTLEGENRENLHSKSENELNEILQREKESNSDKYETLATMRIEDILRDDTESKEDEKNSNIRRQN